MPRLPAHVAGRVRARARARVRVRVRVRVGVRVRVRVRARIRVKVRVRVRVRVRARVGVLTISTRWFSLTVEALRVVLLSLRLVPGQGEFTLG